LPLHPLLQRAYTIAPDTSSFAEIVWLAYTERGLVCARTPEGIALLTGAAPRVVPIGQTLLLGSLHGTAYICFDAAEDYTARLPSVDLRALYGQLPEEQWLIAGYGAQILHWRKTSAFCPLCGAPMGELGQEWARKCTACGHERYPQVSPALLMLVHDGADGILMAHKPGWGDRYSIFAGFVLPGESLEECVHREVLEEAGVTVTDLEYRGSQPWPFPHQLMIGFRARYAGGEVAIDKDELDDARWFRAAQMPELPGKLSLSRQMIDAWVDSILLS
jgi:NAD+ diphosphatase